MWNLISCFVTGHDYAVSCDNGAIFLRCIVCGRRSQGWVVHQHEHAATPAHAHTHAHVGAPAHTGRA